MTSNLVVAKDLKVSIWRQDLSGNEERERNTTTAPRLKYRFPAVVQIA